MREITKIIWHCSGTKDGKPVTLEALIAAHKARGFRTVGYHWIVEPDGKIIKGRPESEVGAHVEGHNHDSIGICLIGSEKFTQAAWDSARLLALEIEERHPSAHHYGHRDFSPDLNHDGKLQKCEWIKTCPGFDVHDWQEAGFIPKSEDIL